MTLIYDQYDEVLAVNASLRKQLGHLRDVLVKCEAERAVQLARSESLQQIVEHLQSTLDKYETRSAAEGDER